MNDSLMYQNELKTLESVIKIPSRPTELSMTSSTFIWRKRIFIWSASEREGTMHPSSFWYFRSAMKSLACSATNSTFGCPESLSCANTWAATVVFPEIGAPMKRTYIVDSPQRYSIRGVGMGYGPSLYQSYYDLDWLMF